MLSSSGAPVGNVARRPLTVDSRGPWLPWASALGGPQGLPLAGETRIWHCLPRSSAWALDQMGRSTVPLSSLSASHLAICLSMFNHPHLCQPAFIACQDLSSPWTVPDQRVHARHRRTRRRRTRPKKLSSTTSLALVHHCTGTCARNAGQGSHTWRGGHAPLSLPIACQNGLRIVFHAFHSSAPLLLPTSLLGSPLARWAGAGRPDGFDGRTKR